jgi:glycopeptide antibiotics resistance protein
MLNKNKIGYRRVQITSVALLFIYLTFLAWRMFFYAYGHYYRVQNAKLRYNLIPFKTIMALLRSFHNYNFNIWIYNLLGNIVVFLPLGILLTLVFKRINIKIILGISFFIILLAETMQLVLRLGVFDIDDIILNLLGCFIGYYISTSVMKCIYLT